MSLWDAMTDLRMFMFLPSISGFAAPKLRAVSVCAGAVISSKRRKPQRGSALIELGLVFTMIMLLFLGVIDFSLVTQQAMVVNEAAYAGAEYGAMSGNSTNYATMQSIAAQSATGISGFSATATKWCACSPGGASVACTANCGAYGTPVAYVQVVTSATAPLLFKWIGIPLSVPIKGVCILRVQ